MPADKSEKIDSSDMMDTHRLRGLEGGGGRGLTLFLYCNKLDVLWLFMDYFFRILFFLESNTPLGTGRKLSDFC